VYATLMCHGCVSHALHVTQFNTYITAIYDMQSYIAFLVLPAALNLEPLHLTQAHLRVHCTV